MYTIHHTILA